MMGNYMQLAKPRIGVMIAMTAVVGYLATVERGQIEFAELAVLVLAMMLGSASSSIFNHFYDRDIDRLMPRTAKRPFAQREIQNHNKVLWVAAGCLFAGCGIAIWVFNPVVATHLFLGAFFYGIVYTVWAQTPESLEHCYWRNGRQLCNAGRRGGGQSGPVVPADAIGHRIVLLDAVPFLGPGDQTKRSICQGRRAHAACRGWQ